ncbi:MAG: nucleotidyltransferase domain-containing protein [Nitrospinae bacterium]|nr:nucleotidyltransferase domain-containing protein [Nitrospinota bacterium]
MDREHVLRVIRDFKEAMESRNVKINKIILFGSCARGDYKEGSDIDVIVISESFKKFTFWERLDIVAEVIGDLFEPIEPVLMTQEEWDAGDSLFVEYAKNGEVFQY